MEYANLSLFTFPRWFSKCVYVRLVKGDHYITECLAARPPDSSGTVSYPSITNKSSSVPAVSVLRKVAVSSREKLLSGIEILGN
jgi:hypothetical protein